MNKKLHPHHSLAANRFPPTKPHPFGHLMALRVKGTVSSAVASPVTTAPAEAPRVALAETVAVPGTSWGFVEV